jgi:predicted lipoprotein with Yx(FWY)xxD motif
MTQPPDRHEQRRFLPVRMLGAVAMLSGALVLASTTASAHVDPRLRLAAARAAKSSAVVVKAVKHGKLGTILATESGYTLYHFTLDTAKKIACTGGCTEAWPPLTLPKGVTHATAGTGVKQALLGTRNRGTELQVTYKGLLLYRYAADTGPGQTNGQGVGGTWFVVKATT